MLLTSCNRKIIFCVIFISVMSSLILSICILLSFFKCSCILSFVGFQICFPISCTYFLWPLFHSHCSLNGNGVVVTTGLVEKCDVTNTDALDVQAAAAVILNADGVYMASISALLLALKLASNGYYTTRDPAKLPFNEVSFNSASYWHSKYHLEKQLSVLSC